MQNHTNHVSDHFSTITVGSIPVSTPRASQTWDPGDIRILMVDDEELNLDVIRGYLSMDGYKQFLMTTDPVQSLQLMEKNDVDIVLLDVQMPVMNGLDVLRAIRGSRHSATLPVIVLTANADDETRLHALKLGATDFLQKPVSRVELTARIQNTLSVKAYHDRLENESQMLQTAVRERTKQLEASRMEVINCLARAAEFRDDDTGNHVLRVGRYARIIGQQMGLDANYLEILEPAAQLHDVGKIGVPDNILLKPGKLTAEEFEYMQRHCGFGKRIVTPMTAEESSIVRNHAELGAKILGITESPILEMAQRIALTHHEKWDGSGYPLGLSGENIPLEGRITAVADVFDALSSKRPYKPAFPLDKCFSIMREGSGQHFDPKCIEAFFAAVDRIVQTQIDFADVE
ncbi:HD-GYP domain-containing protein [Stieleria varia]|uniref:Cyclic di-GMP phosphodiesterase response regulator RpfG n=1 Tax=Stieleria varia TaxID=2528005 RepID=A0A5C6B7A1_9BACT|nr:HD domain-containing phosphohydrolase [Stieleria varia]TWU07667.1 Cyclic di-GMP phosphodiesterase response regulator RpfG [Stieleria varia]